MTRVLCLIGRVLLAVVLLGAGAWAGLAVWIRLLPDPWGTLGGVLVAGATLVAAVALVLRRWRVVAAWAVVFVAVLGWFLSLAPSNHRDWAPDVARTVHGTMTGETLTLHDVRNFLWRGPDDAEPRWETRSYDLSQLTGADLFMSHWDGEAIAHTIVSFTFSDGQYLAFSIEIRREKGEAFSSIAGFFRTYELSVIAADERDVVGVRTAFRGEDVRIYRLRMPPARARALLDEYVALGNELYAHPRFYNTLTTNCTTQIFHMLRAIDAGLPLDWRVLLSGHVPAFIYDRGALDPRVPFATLREKSHIAGRASPSDPEFSRLIRVGVPDPLDRP